MLIDWRMDDIAIELIKISYYVLLLGQTIVCMLVFDKHRQIAQIHRNSSK